MGPLYHHLLNKKHEKKKRNKFLKFYLRVLLDFGECRVVDDGSGRYQGSSLSQDRHGGFNFFFNSFLSLGSSSFGWFFSCFLLSDTSGDPSGPFLFLLLVVVEKIALKKNNK